MKKLSMIAVTFLFLGLGNVVAQSENLSGSITDEVEVQEESSTTKTAADIEETKNCKTKETACKNKKKGCCSAKGSSTGFNFNKSNNYSGSGSSTAKVRCCKGSKKKSSCSKSAAEKVASDDDETSNDETNTDE